MDIDYIIEQAERGTKGNVVSMQNTQNYRGPYIQACEFLRTVADDKS